MAPKQRRRGFQPLQKRQEALPRFPAKAGRHDYVSADCADERRFSRSHAERGGKGGPWPTRPMYLRRYRLALGEGYGGPRPTDFVYFVYFVVEPGKGRCALITEDSTRSISPWSNDVYRRFSTPPRGECTDARKALSGTAATRFLALRITGEFPASATGAFTSSFVMTKGAPPRPVPLAGQGSTPRGYNGPARYPGPQRPSDGEGRHR